METETAAADTPDVAFEYTLAEPITAYGETTKVLKFRKPKGIDLIRVGNPILFSPFTDPPKVEHDWSGGKMLAMIARLSGVPSSSIEHIGPEDLTGIAWMLSPFFIPKA